MIAALAAALVGGGELFGGDHDRHLDQQRREGQGTRRIARQEGCGHAEHAEGEGEIVAAQRIQDIDASGEDRARFLLAGRTIPGH